MPEPLDWDEFRLVHAIAEAQSLAGAAERLGLNHSTLFRRLAALEGRLGVKLFQRERSGYRPTAAGEDMVALATLMGDTIAEFERRVTQNEVEPAGRVRLTTLDPLGEQIMPEIVAALTARHPGLQVELILTDLTVDLQRGEADLALRCQKGPPPGLVGRKIAPLNWAVYAAADAPGVEAFRGPWAAPSESAMPLLMWNWMDRHVEPRRRAAIVNRMLTVADLAARGVGAALLPCFVAHAWPQLRRIGEADPEMGAELWIVATERALRIPRVRATYDFIGDELERRRARFAGEDA
jgi:DNA-binding transcriptional LysR family regulator